ncbi:MAG TPA: c-type cytochrome [Candidatus Acidoferrales bacterium]|nr:c-type cytochrome [Candidatus Acidoferrales bacterium]
MKTGFSMRAAFRIVLAASALAFLALALQWPGVLARTRSQSQSPAQQQGATPQANAQASGVRAQGPQAMEGKTAAEYYKNIQILKDIPANQLIPSMQYISVALGVGCDFCHVPGDRAKDDKREKQTARKMMTMMFAINKDNFNARPQVSCYTCHRAASHPAAMPSLPELASATPAEMPAANAMQRGEGNRPAQGAAGAAAAPAGPSAADILQKYVQALGGENAIAKISTLSEQGTVEAPARGPQGSAPQPATMETIRKTPDKALAILHRGNGAVTQGFDGSAGWEQRGTRVTDETGDALARVKLWAEFIPGLNLAKNPRARVMGTEKVGDHEAYRVVVFESGAPVTYDFDTQSGLLLRVATRITTPLGSLPVATDYDDYRDVSGVKVPFTVRTVRMEGTTTDKWNQVQANVPVEDSRFAKPAPAGSGQ